MTSEDKTYCGQDDRSHVDQGDNTTFVVLSKKLGISVQDIQDIMAQQKISVNRVEEYIRNKQNAY